MIEQVVQRDLMPPWFAAESEAARPGTLSPWTNDCSLAELEKLDLLSWLAGPLVEGDAREAPLAREFASEWQIGEPDAVFQFDKPQAVKATGVMPYKHVDVQTDLAEDQWVQAIEVQPGNRSVVHHVLVFVQGAGQEHSERDGFWGIYVPGNSALIYPEGFAKRIPKRAKLRFQMHYTPNGTATTDQTRIGLVFAKTPPRHEVRVTGIFNDKISIPAGADNHPEVANLPIPADARVMGFLPHMHLRGKAARYELVRAGETTTLLDVPRYDFNWQLLYRYREPLQLNAGDTIRFTSWYDNSARTLPTRIPRKPSAGGRKRMMRCKSVMSSITCRVTAQVRRMPTGRWPAIARIARNAMWLSFASLMSTVMGSSPNPKFASACQTTKRPPVQSSIDSTRIATEN